MRYRALLDKALRKSETVVSLLHMYLQSGCIVVWWQGGCTKFLIRLPVTEIKQN